MGSGLEKKGLEREPIPATDMNEIEEFTLKTNGLVKLQYRRGDMAREGSRIFVSGEVDMYEVAVEGIEQAPSPTVRKAEQIGRVPDAHFTVRLIGKVDRTK